MQINLDILIKDIKDTVQAYDDVKGIVLQASLDSEQHIDQIGMILTFDDASKMSLYGTFEVFDFTVDGMQALYDMVVLEFTNLDVNLIMG